MRSTFIACVVLLAMAAITVSAQNTMEDAPLNPPKTYPAIMTKPADNLKKPIIFDPTRHGTKGVVTDEPLMGTPPAALKKSAVSTNIFGGAIEYVRGRHPQTGCACRKQKPEKFRYDTEFKPEKVKQPRRCGCKKKEKKPLIPPVIPEMKPVPPKVKKGKLVPCAKPAKKKETIAPEYKPKKLKAPAPTNCTKPVPPKPATIAPEFYPVNVKAQRAARRARKAAAKAAAAK
jgi:hypothetical protein